MPSAKLLSGIHVYVVPVAVEVKVEMVWRFPEGPLRRVMVMGEVVSVVFHSIV